MVPSTSPEGTKRAFGDAQINGPSVAYGRDQGPVVVPRGAGEPSPVAAAFATAWGEVEEFLAETDAPEVAPAPRLELAPVAPVSLPRPGLARARRRVTEELRAAAGEAEGGR
jgi:hypothetical protein